MSITPRDRKILTGLVVLVLLAAYWFIAIKPKRAEVTRLGQEVSEKQDELQTARAQLTLFAAAQKSYPADYAAVIKLGEAVPDDDAIPSLLVQLDEIAKRRANFSQIEVKRYPLELLAPSFTGVIGSDPSAAGASGATVDTGSATQSAPTADGSAQQSTSQADSPQTGSGQAASSTASTGSLPLGSQLKPVEVRLQFQGNFFKINKVFAGIDRLVRLSGGAVVVGGRLIFIEGFKFEEGIGSFPNVAGNVGAVIFSLPEGQSVGAGGTAQAPSKDAPQPTANGATDQSTPSTASSPATGTAPTSVP